jgi:cysteine desulfurases, SufS subfamily
MFDINKIRKDFPMLNGKKMAGKPLIYFDNAATTFKPNCVIEAVSHYYTETNGSIHRGDYELSYQLSEVYEEARGKIAKFINAKENEIVFTSGASASLNLVAYGYGQKFLQEGDIILSSEAEHASNILPWFKAAEVTGAIVEYIPLSEEGVMTVDSFRQAMHEKVKVVTIANISNVLGHLVPIKEIAEIAHQYGAIVVVDGAQSVPHIPTDVKDWDIDFLAFSGHKMLGPTGVGILFGKYELLDIMDPFMLGGGSNARFDICGNVKLKEPPFKFEAGTPAIEAVLGLSAAVDYLEELGMADIEAYEHELRNYLMEQLSKLEHIHVYNPNAATGIVTFNVKGVFAQDAASYLNAQGIAVRAGNHCAKILMDVLKTSETVRASIYFYNTRDEVDQFIVACKEITLENTIDLIL